MFIISFIIPPNEYGCVYAARKYSDRSNYRRCRFWQKKIIFSDEAHFILGEYVNKQNCRIWDTKTPHAYIEAIFFENEQGEAVTSNGDRYRAM